jgi:microcystin-dependent protein
MGQPYVGEIRMFGGSFAPAGWAFCDGQLLPISENETLFQLIGTTYGGDGEATFALPGLSSRVPIHQGQGPGLSNNILGETGGVESVTLSTQQIPSHTHPVIASQNLANDFSPGNKVFAQSQTIDAYVQTPPFVALSPQSVSPVGGSQPHDNMQPYLVVSFIISLFGVFPQPT